MEEQTIFHRMITHLCSTCKYEHLFSFSLLEFINLSNFYCSKFNPTQKKKKNLKKREKINLKWSNILLSEASKFVLTCKIFTFVLIAFKLHYPPQINSADVELLDRYNVIPSSINSPLLNIHSKILWTWYFFFIFLKKNCNFFGISLMHSICNYCFLLNLNFTLLKILESST